VERVVLNALAIAALPPGILRPYETRRDWNIGLRRKPSS